MNPCYLIKDNITHETSMVNNVRSITKVDMKTWICGHVRANVFYLKKEKSIFKLQYQLCQYTSNS